MDLTMKRCGCGNLWRPVGRASRCGICLRREAERLMRERSGEESPGLAQFDPQASGRRPSTPPLPPTAAGGFVWELVELTRRYHPTGGLWSPGVHACLVTHADASKHALLVVWQGKWELCIGGVRVGMGRCLYDSSARLAAERRLDVYWSTGS